MVEQIWNGVDIAQRAERLFDKRVLKVIAPGGRKRGSIRIVFADQTIIATRRDSVEETKAEAHILEQLTKHTSSCAGFLAMDGDVMFQTDVGQHRLGQYVRVQDPSDWEDVAVKTVRSLFDVHVAGNASSLPQDLKACFMRSGWIKMFVNDPARVAKKLGQPVPEYDKDALAEIVKTPERRFIKWDCRAGNAATDEAGKIRWFDFEYAGLRHGAEDFAWLVADENWPLPADTMLLIIGQEYGRGETRSWDSYRSYLEIFATLQAINRILQVFRGVKRKGWISEHRALHYDDVGINPRLAIHLCDNGRILADRNGVTRPIVPVFEAARKAFAETMN
ncbi:MAG: phosphotransferase [Rhodobacteraceae bacterium]|nr:phosphotransferase [Paracoccaceae bacterium]